MQRREACHSFFFAALLDRKQQEELDRINELNPFLQSSKEKIPGFLTILLGPHAGERSYGYKGVFLELTSQRFSNLLPCLEPLIVHT